MNTKYPFTQYTPISRNPNIPLTPIPYEPSCLTNPSCFPSSSTSSSNTTVSSNPNLKSSSSNGTPNPVNSLPPPQTTNFKIPSQNSNQEKALSSARALTPRKKLNRERISTVAKPPTSISECGNQFFSPKAIHGHMRHHPERKWRGMKTPAKEFVMEPSNLGPSQNTEEEIEAAWNLIFISKGKYEDWMGEVRKRGKLSGFKEQRNAKEAKVVNGGSSVEKKDFVGLDLDFSLSPSAEKVDEEGSTNNFNPNHNLGLRHL